jgi:hypothetical protein
MASPNSITVSALDIITSAMTELGILAAGENAQPADAEWAFTKLQRLIDRYNARLAMIYNVGFTLFTLNPPATGSALSTSIGPGAEFDCNQRPVSIPSIGLIIGGTPGVEVPLNCRDDEWWANNRIKGLTSTLPTDYYYSPNWDVQEAGGAWGQIFFWPVPTASYQVNLCSRQVLTEFTSVTDDFTMPPAYWDLIVYELAISLAPSFSRQPDSVLLQGYKIALKAVQVNNISSPRLRSDSPSQTSGSSRPDFSFLDGLSR